MRTVVLALSVVACGRVDFDLHPVGGDAGDGSVIDPDATPCTGPDCCIAELALGGGDSHVCARKTDGTLWCWGRGLEGQLGNGGLIDEPMPVQVNAPFAAIQIITSLKYTCARDSNDDVWCWGRDDENQLGTGTIMRRTVPARTLVDDVVDLQGGEDHACAMRSAGGAVCWGKNIDGQLGRGDADPHVDVVDIAVPNDIVQVSPGESHTCVRTGDGAVWCMGGNTSGQLGDGTVVAGSLVPVRVMGLPPVVEVVHGLQHSCAREADGSVWCWGANGFEQLGVTGGDRNVATRAAFTGAVRLFAGETTTCGVRADHTGYCWGLNSSGQLGGGFTTATSATPVQVLVDDVDIVSPGFAHACARRRNGEVWCWGDGATGQLGNGLNTSSAMPVRVALTCP